MTQPRYILVTGGAGYIGSHTCKALARAGFVPVVYDNLSRGHRHAVKWGPFELGDIGDARRLDEVMHAYRFEAVIHFAAFAYVGESMQHPSIYYKNNVVGSLSLLEAMHRNKVKRIVFSSTCATYGIPEKSPITEDTPQCPINPYGASKLMVEWMIRDFGSACELRSVCLRYFNAAGSDPEGELGEEHDPETHLIPLVLEVAIGTRSHISVYGDQYDTSDGTCIRDYIHVSDLADAHVRSLDYLLNGGDSVALNLGNGHGFSVWEVINVVAHVTKRKIEHVIAPPRLGDPPVLVSDAEKAREVLGWEPSYKALEDHVAHAWQWMQKSKLRQA